MVTPKTGNPKGRPRKPQPRPGRAVYVDADTFDWLAALVPEVAAATGRPTAPGGVVAFLRANWAPKAARKAKK